MLNIKQIMSHVFAVVLVLGVFFFSLSFNIVNKKMNFYNKKNNDINQTFTVNVLQSYDPNVDVNYTFSNITIVTAFYDIQRSDRQFNQTYIQWIEETLQIPFSMIVFCHPRHREIVLRSRQFTKSNTHVVTSELFPLERFSDDVEIIINKIGNGRSSPEWTNSRYIPIQFSKFAWLLEAIQKNPFQSEYFCWLDAGISRFFLPGQPLSTKLSSYDLLERNKIIIQAGMGQTFPPQSVTLGAQKNYFMGGSFGGDIKMILKLCHFGLGIFLSDMLSQGMVDNEQYALGFMYLKHPDWFKVFGPNHLGRESCIVLCL